MTTTPRKVQVYYGDLRDTLGEEHVGDVFNWATLLQILHISKEKVYDRSFARRGLVGVYMNLARKYDAIDTMARKEQYDDDFVDTLADLAVYSLKMLDVINKTNPEAVNSWLQDVYCKFTDKSMAEALQILKGVSND